MIDPEILQVLEDYSIQKQDIKNVESIFSGLNRVHSVETIKEKLILKEYIELSSSELPKVHNNLLLLMNKGVGIPEILKNIHGEYITNIDRRNFDLSRYIEHVDLSDQLTISDENLKLAAKELAKIHKITNSPEISKNLRKVDFELMIEETLKSLQVFEEQYKDLLQSAEGKDKEKLVILKKIIELTDNYRKGGVRDFSLLLNQKFVPTHGDYSMVNVLINGKKVFVIDWDNFKLRPLVWDIQAAFSLFSLSVLGNAYFVEPNLKKLETFLTAYVKENPAVKDVILLLPEAAKFNFSIYWLSYTIPAVLKRDFRLLYLIPDDTEKALYWTKHFDDYVAFIEEFIKNNI